MKKVQYIDKLRVKEDENELIEYPFIVIFKLVHSLMFYVWYYNE